jgi:delta-1-pyrroline-5-carboxylate synthetase
MHTTTTNLQEPLSRAALRNARRVVIKAGTSVVANPDGTPSLCRLGAIVEQIAELNQAGIEVIFVSSGAVGMGKQLLRKQARLNMSFKDLHKGGNPIMRGISHEVAANGVTTAAATIKQSTSLGNLMTVDEHMETSAAKSFAAAGQFELMSLFQSLFNPKVVTASQMLLTQADFKDEHHLKNLRYAVERLLGLGIVPIINENDAVSVFMPDGEEDPVFADNDSLAAVCARSFGAEVLVLLTDVDGVYNMPPSNPKAKIIPFYHSNSSVAIGEKSAQGRGGMAAKLDAAQKAVLPGSNCAACVIAAGSDLNAVRSILNPTYKEEFGPSKGTLFCTPGSDLEKLAITELVDNVDVSYTLPKYGTCLER